MEDLGEPPTTARWLAWATAVLLIIGVISAGVMNLAGERPDQGVVAAAGRAGGTLDVPVTTLPPVTTIQRSTPPATSGRSTTVPKAAAAVLRAIASTVPPTTQPPATSTTVAPVTSTTAPPPTSTTSTSTTLAPRVTLTVANEHTLRLAIVVNDGPLIEVDAGKEVPLTVADNGSEDRVVVAAPGTDPACGARTTGDLFRAGGTFRVTVGNGKGACPVAPEITVTPPV